MSQNDKTWSPQQEAIFEWFTSGAGNLVVRARAGTGKSTVILEGINRAPEQKILLCAFNKRIADELVKKLRNPRAEAKTLHGVGFGCIKQYWNRVNVDNDRGERLVREAMGPLSDSAPFEAVRLAANLASKGKEIEPLTATEESLVDLAIQFDLIPDDNIIAQWPVQAIAKVASAAMKLSAVTNDGTIDFSDMLYLPLVNGWAHGKYDMVVVDECFPGDTPILLADKTTLPISKIVDEKLNVKILSFDEKTGTQVVKRVTGVKKVLLQKKTYRITIRQVGFISDGSRMSASQERVRFGTRHLVCTEDHKIFVRGEWKAVKDIKAGEFVQLESSAPRSKPYNHRYKHGLEGKQKLRDCITPRASGLGNSKNSNFKVRGGNGKGLTIPQKILLEALGPAWQAEFVVPTGGRIIGERPTCYKIDIAHPGCKIAIEVDGQSHRGVRKEADERKQAFLESKGWKVYRFKNQDAFKNAEEIAASMPRNCPIDAEVLSVVEYPIKDYYVYDLQIEDTHCYYAHGILVHNCQDMNQAQILLAQRVCRKSGRIVVVGDDRQAIYGFRGADSGSLDRLKKELEASELGLTITYRCPKSIVAEAQEYVPDYEAAPTAPEGIVSNMNREKMLQAALPGDFILSRKNAPLAGVCLALMREGRKAKIEGRDIGKGLTSLVRKLKGKSLSDLFKKLETWRGKEIDRAQSLSKKSATETRMAYVNDQAETIVALSEGVSSVNELEKRIESLFTDNNIGNSIVCSTVHKSKGLESDRVFVLDNTFTMSGPEEDNIMYVCVTRAKKELVYVHESE